MFVVRVSIEEHDGDACQCIEDNIEFGPSFRSEADARRFVADVASLIETGNLERWLRKYTALVEELASAEGAES